MVHNNAGQRILDENKDGRGVSWMISVNKLFNGNLWNSGGGDLLSSIKCEADGDVFKYIHVGSDAVCLTHGSTDEGVKYMDLDSIDEDPYMHMDLSSFIKQAVTERTLPEGKLVRFNNISREDMDIAEIMVGRNILNIGNPSEATKEIAIRINPRSFEDIDNPSYELRSLALSLDGMLLDYISTPTAKEKLIAFEQNPLSVVTLTAYDELMFEKVLSSKEHAFAAFIELGTQYELSDELIKVAVTTDPRCLSALNDYDTYQRIGEELGLKLEPNPSPSDMGMG